MECPENRRRLIVNADDFGRSNSINAAVVRAHREGILTTASLMVNESASVEAVELARQNPSLGVGLHLTLLRGHSSLTPIEIPGLVDEQRRFSENPVAAGFRYFAVRRLRSQLRDEIHAQFRMFRQTGLCLDHVNGHLHLHMHPTVFSILNQDKQQLGITHFRLVRDPLWLNLRLAPGRWFYRLSHAWFHSLLAWRIEPELQRSGIRHPKAVFGLLQNGCLDETYLQRLLPRLPAGDSELYSHPSLDEFKAEFDALISSRVTSLVEQLRIQRIRYQDL